MLTTQHSLIARLKDPSDDEAWRQFASLYHPAIVRSLQRKGLQYADAEDTAQQVLLSVAKSLAQRPHDPNRARFRTWLEKVIRNAAINAMRRPRKDKGDGGTSAVRALESLENPSSDEKLLRDEYRRQVFHIAAETVKIEFESDTWDAFWRTAVLGEPIETVAKDLGKQRGSVYAARSRVMARFRNEIQRMELDFSAE